MSSNNVSQSENHQLQEQLKELAEARISVMPTNMRLSVGSSEYSKEELLKHIHAGDEVGKEIIAAQLDFLKALATGAIYDNG